VIDNTIILYAFDHGFVGGYHVRKAWADGRAEEWVDGGMGGQRDGWMAGWVGGV
jgi:arylsulfatase A-like enzyme